MTRTSTPTTRRRFLGIAAASAALLGATPLQAALRHTRDLPPFTTWHGIALGANAQMQLLHPDPKKAQQLIQLAINEIHRLERIFSLYRDDSALVRLNHHGRLDAPPADLRRLLSEAIALAELTEGYFDPTVQPLWNWYVHQGQHPGQPPALSLQQTLATVNYQAIDIQPGHVRLTQPGMALTLNGIAQGYITDRVTELLRANGLEHALIDLGEARSLGQPSTSRLWRAGLANPDADGQLLDTITLHDNQAVATSSGSGTPLDASGRLSHLFDPHTGSATPRWHSVSVRAHNATTADALSTAFSQMHEDKIRAIVSRFPADAWLLPNGTNQLLHLS